MEIRRMLKSGIVDLRKMLKMFRALDREAVAAHVLSGQGIEVGGLHNPLRVPRGVRVCYVDRMSVPDLRRHYPELSGRTLTRVDIVDNGETLTTVPDASQDFVIANHFLEHCENPLATLNSFVRVVKPGGVLFLCLPDKRYTFDLPREVTPFEHLVRDYNEGPAWSRRGHYLDWVYHVEHVTDPPAREGRAEQLMAQEYSIHYHVWTIREMMEMVLRIHEVVPVTLSIETFLASEGEVIVVLRTDAT